MKKLFYLMLLLAGVLLASCSSEMPVQDPNLQNGSNAICFRVSAPATSRAAHSYCNQSLPESFKVWAYLTKEDGTIQVYIDGETATKGADNTYSFNKPQYWPGDKFQQLEFVAVTDDEGGYDPVSKEFSCSVSSDVASQNDPMMAMCVASGDNHENTINLTFNHLLSQIVFNAKCKDGLKVTVNTLSVEGCLKDKGIAVYRSATDAEGGYFEHEDENGEWLDRFNWLSREKSDVFNGYAITFNPSKVITYNVENTSTKLTGAPENHEDGDWSQVMTLLPQTTPAWVHGKTLAEQAASGYGLLVINAKIVDAESSKVLYEGDIYTGIPANWSSGKRYTYTLNFGEGDNSWQGPDPEDPNIYGFPISLNVSVSDFVDVNGGQVLDPKHVNYNNAEVGDFMMNDGTLVKAQSAKYLSDAEKDNVIGMVAYVYNKTEVPTRWTNTARANDILNNKKNNSTRHGLVISLKNMESESWGPMGDFSDNFKTHKFIFNQYDTNSSDNAYVVYNDGLEACENIWNSDNISEFPVFKSVKAYRTEEASTGYEYQNYTTGWYLPSIGEWMDIISNDGIGGLDWKHYGLTDTNGIIWTYVRFDIVLERINTYLKALDPNDNAGYFDAFKNQQHYWSSSDCTINSIYGVNFQDNKLSFGDRWKSAKDATTRCILAF